MNYFDYAQEHGIYKTMQIFNEVQSLKGYAISVYKNLWEDALDKSFFHILENYDENSGYDLSHYAIRVVGTILLNKYNNEIEHETSLTAAMDKKSYETKGLNPLEVLLEKEEEEVSNHVNSCVEYLLPYFLQDYKFFKSRKSEDRKLSYTGLFDKFSESTVYKAMSTLLEKYGDAIEYLYEVKQKCTVRNYPENRYESFLDTMVEYQTMFRNVLIYKKLSRKSKKYFYSIDLKNLKNSILNAFYEKDMYKREVGELTFYCSLSGSIVSSIEDLLNCLENELVGYIVSKCKVKVVLYDRGATLLVSSSKEIEKVILNIFGIDFPFELKRVVAKCIN